MGLKKFHEMGSEVTVTGGCEASFVGCSQYFHHPDFAADIPQVPNISTLAVGLALATRPACLVPLHLRGQHRRCRIPPIRPGKVVPMPICGHQGKAWRQNMEQHNGLGDLTQ